MASSLSALHIYPMISSAGFWALSIMIRSMSASIFMTRASNVITYLGSLSRGLDIFSENARASLISFSPIGLKKPSIRS